MTEPQQPAPLQSQQMQQPAPPQPQQVQQPAPPQPQQVPQPSMITFSTTAPEPQPAQVTQPLQPANGSYQSIIEQQQAQINALIQQNNNLNAQVTQMVQNGAQFGQPTQQVQQVQQAQPAQYPNVYQPADLQEHPLSTFNPASLANDEDYSLESLAKEIGKRE